MRKRLTAMLLVVCMLFTFMPMTAFAEGGYAIGAEIISTEENLPTNIPENTEWVLKDEKDTGTQNLVCDNPAHTGHTADCYSDKLICGHDEGHNPSCYDKTGEWIKCSEKNCLHYHEEGVLFPRNVHDAKLGDGCWLIGAMAITKAACEAAKLVREFWGLDTAYLDAQIEWMKDVLKDYKNPLDFVHYVPADDAKLICSHGDAHTQDCYELICKDKEHTHKDDCYETVYTWVLQSKLPDTKPVRWYVAIPGKAVDGNAEHYLYLGVGGASGYTGSSYQNLDDESEVLDKADLSWPAELTASGTQGSSQIFFKADGTIDSFEITFVEDGVSTTYTDEEYELRWIKVMSGYNWTDASGVTLEEDNFHMDGMLYKKVTIEDIFAEDAVNGIVKTYEAGTTAADLAVWGDDFAFELTTVENVGEDVGPIALEANDVPLTGKNLTVQNAADAQTVLTPGIYQVSEKLTAEQAKKWTTADDLYIFVYTDGTFEYKKDAEGEQDASGIQNTPETYTVIYMDGSEELQSTSDLKYGAATPAYDTAALEKAGYVFDGWVPAVEPTIDVSIANEDNEIVYTAQWAADENGDQIADKYQRTLTFRVVNGAWNDGKTEDVEIVVTLRDASGKLSETGSHTLTAEDLAGMPSAGEKPDEGYKAGAWDKALPKAGDVITANASYTYTYVEKPIVNISKELLEPDKQYQNGDSVTYQITVEIVKAADLESITLTEEPGAALLNGAFVLNDGDGNSLIKNLLTGMKAQSGNKKFDAELNGNTLTIKEVDSMINLFDVNFADGDTFTFYYTAKLGIGSINPDITVKTVDWDEVEAAVKGLKLPAAIEACALAKLKPAYDKLVEQVEASVDDLNDLIDKTLQEVLGSTTENEVTAKDQNCDELGGGKTDPIKSVGIAKPDLTVTKTVKDEKVYAPGDTVEYNINVKNTGDTLLLGMVVTDIPGKGLINGKLDVPEEIVDLVGGRAVKSFLNGKITVEFKFDWKKMLANGFTGLDDLQNAFSKDALMAKLQELANMEKPENAGALLGQIEQAMNDFLAKYEWLDVTVYICDRTVAIGRLDEGESLDFTYTATICQMADGKVTNCAVSALGDKSCVTITVKNPEVPVYFYIEGLNNEGYDVDEVIGNDPLSVEEGFVFLNAMLADDCGIKTIVKDDKNVRDWLDAKLSDGYSISIFDLDYLIAKANENDRNALDKNDYKDWAFTQAEWIEGDNAWHVHLKLIPKVVVNLTVDYVDENGNTIQDSKTTQLKEDEGYTIDKSNIVTADGRTYTCIGWKVNDGVLSTDPSVLYSSAIGTSDVTFTLVYQLIQADITFYIRNTVITTDDKRDADITDMPNTHEGYDLIGKKTVGITPKGAALIGADPWYVFDNTNNCKYYFGAYIGANGIVSNAENANTITLGETGNTVKAFSVTVDGKVFTEENAILKIVKFGYYDDGYHADCIVIPKTTPVVPTAAVYQTEYYFEQEDGSYQKDDAETVRKTASLDALVEAEQKSFDDYAYDETKTAADGLTSGKVFLPEAIKDGDDNVVGVKILTLKLYYSIDKIGGGKDAEKPDKIPDKYEIIVKYTTDGHGTIEKPESKYQTFDVRKLEQNNDGTYTIRLTAEADANSRYKFKSWTGDFQLSGQDATLDADVDAEVGTYVVEANFKKKSSGSSSGEKKPTLNTDEHFQYVMGYTDGTVRPLNKITRAEVAAIFYRLLDDETREYYFTTENDFPDMNDTMWYNKAVSTLANAGIITGCSDGLFHGGRNITRAELATIIAKFDEITYRGEDLFSDISGHWAREYINSSADKGWIVGDGTGKFRPYDDITRAEVMTMINAVLNRAVDEDGLCKGYKKWPDNTKGTWYYYQVIEATNYHEYTWQDGDPEENWTDILPDKTWDEAGR